MSLLLTHTLGTLQHTPARATIEQFKLQQPTSIPIMPPKSKLKPAAAPVAKTARDTTVLTNIAERVKRKRDSLSSEEESTRPDEAAKRPRPKMKDVKATEELMRSPQFILDNLSSHSSPFPRPLLEALTGGSVDDLRAAVEPAHPMNDQVFVVSTMQHLTSGLQEHRTVTMQSWAMERMLLILGRAQLATDEDGPFLTPEEFESRVHDHPVFFRDQQTMPLMTIKEVMDELSYDEKAQIFVMDGSRKEAKDATVVKTIKEVKTRFSKTGKVKNPWNCLELAALYEDGTRPFVLNGQDFRLLTKIKTPSKELDKNVTKVCRRSLEAGYKDAEKWMLLAQGGALTLPHQDSHGYNTYITVNDGIIGYGWLHQPTKKQRQAWIKDPAYFVDGDWRYRVLRPGETVYFPSGTVHFVFRHPDLGNTFAFGGHILRCSTIVSWLKAMIEEAESNGEITNEDWNSAAFTLIEQVTKFVQQAVKQGDKKSLERWGGKDSVKEFLKLKKTMIKAAKEDVVMED